MSVPGFSGQRLMPFGSQRQPPLTQSLMSAPSAMGQAGKSFLRHFMMFNGAVGKAKNERFASSHSRYYFRARQKATSIEL